jgi:LuxR family maltose regulon positive regulatory protein
MGSRVAEEQDAPAATLSSYRSPHFVSRSRVRRCLTEAATSCVVVVTGPPGAGKTLAVADWLSTTTKQVAWASLETADTEPRTFWSTLIDAVRQVVPGFGDDSYRSLSQPCIGDELWSGFLRDANAVPEPTVLVVDDLHHVDNPAVDAGLEWLVEHLPQTFQLVIVSRDDPPFPLGRWRAHGVVGEVRQADLAFRVDEVAEFLATFPDLSLDREDVAILTGRTEGWAAAVQLGVLALLGQPDPGAQVRSLAGDTRMIADFLVAEVLDHQPAEIREFLIALSVLEKFDADLGAAVSGRSDADQLLRQLERSNMFLVPLDGRRRWYRFHRLFAELLRHELDTRQPDRARSLHLAAARHLDERGDLGTAVQHYLAGGEIDHAFDLSTNPVPGRRRVARDTRSFVPFPADYVSHDLGRIITYASALTRLGSHDEAAAWLQRAERWEDAATDPAVRRRVDEVWAGHYCLLADADRGMLYGRRAIAGCDDAALRSSPAILLCLAQSQLLAGDPRAALQVLSKVDPSPSEELADIVLPALRAHARLELGDVTEAARLADEALAAAAALGVPDHAATFTAHLTRTGCLAVRNELVAANEALDRTIARAEVDDHPLFVLLAHVERARLASLCGSPGDALDELAATRTLLARRGVDQAVLCQLDAVEARYHADTGDLARARAAVRNLRLGRVRSLLEARFAALEGDAEALMRTLGGARLTSRRDRLETELLLVRLHAVHDHAAARHHAARAARLAAPERLVSPVLQEGVDTALVVRAEAEAASVPVLDRLAADLGSPALVRTPPALVDPLSEREISVLRYLPTHLTNPDIAGDLYISVNTLKTHIKAIYRKLGATSRDEAVQVGREIGLLPRSAYRSPPRGSSYR